MILIFIFLRDDAGRLKPFIEPYEIFVIIFLMNNLYDINQSFINLVQIMIISMMYK